MEIKTTKKTHIVMTFDELAKLLGFDEANIVSTGSDLREKTVSVSMEGEVVKTDELMKDQTLEAYRGLRVIEERLAKVREILDDPDMSELAKDDKDELEERREKLIVLLQALDPMKSKTE